MHHTKRLTLVDSECLRSPDSVLDLPTIERMLGEIGEVLFCERHSIDPLEEADALDEELEDCFFSLWRELAVAEGDVDA